MIFNQLLHRSLFYSFQKNGDKTAVISSGIEYSYNVLNDDVTKLAGYLKNGGLMHGDRAIIFMHNTYECIVSIYAVLSLGGVFALVNPQTKKDKFEFIINDAEATVVLSESNLFPIFSEFLDVNPFLKLALIVGEDIGINSLKVHQYDEALSGELHSTNSINSNILLNDLASLIYTSGSTGHPKGVMQTHHSMGFAIESLTTYLKLSIDDVFLLVSPISFDYGLYQVLMSIKLGATIVLEKSFNYPANILKSIDQYDVTVFPGVPTTYGMLVDIYNRTGKSYPSVARVTNTASALPSEYIPTLRKMFPNALVYCMYGLTECKRVSYLEPEKIDTKPTSVGKAIPGTEVFILNEEGNNVEVGEVGTLYVRGPHLMKGYWNQPQLTQEYLKEGKFLGDKMLCTHDYFKMDKDGDLYFVGRDDDIIKTKSEKVSPVEIENVLYGIKGIKEVAVIGVPDELYGQSIKAFIVLDQDNDLDKKTIMRHLKNNLENFMLPKYVEFLSHLPKTNTGKISKKNLACL